MVHRSKYESYGILNLIVLESDRRFRRAYCVHHGGDKLLIRTRLQRAFQEFIFMLVTMRTLSLTMSHDALTLTNGIGLLVCFYSFRFTLRTSLWQTVLAVLGSLLPIANSDTKQESSIACCMYLVQTSNWANHLYAILTRHKLMTTEPHSQHVAWPWATVCFGLSIVTNHTMKVFPSYKGLLVLVFI